MGRLDKNTMVYGFILGFTLIDIINGFYKSIIVFVIAFIGIIYNYKEIYSKNNLKKIKNKNE